MTLVMAQVYLSGRGGTTRGAIMETHTEVPDPSRGTRLSTNNVRFHILGFYNAKLRVKLIIFIPNLPLMTL